MAFEGLSSDAFAAYTPDKWSSNVHNLARMRVKDVMLALCDLAQDGLDDELSGLSRAASDEVPNITNHKKVDAQWVYWFRDAAAREDLKSSLQKTELDQQKLFDIAPQDKHITLAVILGSQSLWVGLRIAPGATVDRGNFAAIMEKTWEREQFLELLKELPDGAVGGFEGDLVPTTELTLASLATTDTSAWQLGHSLPADEAIELGVDLADHVRRWLGALTPHYRFLAWAKSNDHINMGRQIQEEKAQKRRQALGYSPGDRVRIISGAFAGKSGIVQDIDTKAQVKVQVGKMSLVVNGADLTPAA
jgi:hypothetical protein